MREPWAGPGPGLGQVDVWLVNWSSAAWPVLALTGGATAKETLVMVGRDVGDTKPGTSAPLTLGTLKRHL